MAKIRTEKTLPRCIHSLIFNFLWPDISIVSNDYAMTMATELQTPGSKINSTSSAC